MVFVCSIEDYVFPLCAVCSTVVADIQFLLDTSASVGSTDFTKVRDFVKTFAENFDIGADSVHIGVTSFDTTPQNEFWLNQYTNKTALLAAIDQIQYRGGQTYTAEALQFVQENAFTLVSLCSTVRFAHPVTETMVLK